MNSRDFAFALLNTVIARCIIWLASEETPWFFIFLYRINIEVGLQWISHRRKVPGSSNGTYISVWMAMTDIKCIILSTKGADY
jgi:hypothetical protein